MLEIQSHDMNLDQLCDRLFDPPESLDGGEVPKVAGTLRVPSAPRRIGVPPVQPRGKGNLYMECSPVPARSTAISPIKPRSNRAFAAQRRIDSPPQTTRLARYCLPAFLALGLLCLFFAKPEPRPIDRATATVASVHKPKYETVNIEDLRLFWRVLANNPQVTYEERASFVDPDSGTWRFIYLQMQKADGSQVQIELARALAWLEEHKAEVGGTIYLDMPEVGAQGDAQVLAIEPCAALRTGPAAPSPADSSTPPPSASNSPSPASTSPSV